MLVHACVYILQWDLMEYDVEGPGINVPLMQQRIRLNTQVVTVPSFHSATRNKAECPQGLRVNVS